MLIVASAKSRKVLLNLFSTTEDEIDKIDLFNEEFWLDHLRRSSLVIIFMKNLDEVFLTEVSLIYLHLFDEWFIVELVYSLV